MSIRKHPTMSGHWQIIISQGKKGKQIVIVRECDEAEAVRLDKQLNAMVKGERFTVEPTIASAYVDYVEYYKTENQPRSLTDMMSVFRRLILPEFGKYTPKQIVSPLVRQYMNKRLESGVTHRTIHKELSYFGGMLTWMHEEAHLIPYKPTLPKPSIDLCAPKKETEPLTMAEFARVCKFIDHDKLVIFMLFAYCGLRVTEGATMRIENINLDKGYFHQICKGGKLKRKVIPKSKVLIKYLKEAIGDQKSGYLVINPKTKEPYRSFKTTIKTAARKAGIQQHVTHHNFRHAFSAALEDEEIPDSVHMQLMGHTTLDANIKYRHRSQKRAQEYADRIAVKMDDAFLTEEVGSETLKAEATSKRPSYLRLVK